tara:strand:+ start:2539 stop:4311 length:1773 start_codon:yes stop_codon:yes gene_type:complete
MNRQMSMFEEGGIADDGMNRDPVSGNEIPSGSLASEVRDDIPAQLSEGEYVVPADVVRYFGVRVFEEMRNEAKMGLQSMEQDGRIGGEPVEPNKAMTEDDLAGLEEMMRTGVANGGLMDKMVYTAMNDPVVNQKLNQGGMTVSFAAGGMAQSPYNDPTRIDQVIGQFMQMTKNNPGIMDELAKRGITINRTNATQQPAQMQAQNAPAQTTNPVTNQTPIKAAEGTYLDPLSMSGLGTLGQKENYATTPTGLSSMFGVPGASYFYQGPGVPDRPADEVAEVPVVSPGQPQCPPGTMYDPETQTCVPIQGQTKRNKLDDPAEPYDITKEFRYKAGKLDWSDPEGFQAYMDDLSKPQEKMPGLLKVIPGANLAAGAGFMLDRKTTVMKIKGMESLAILTGNQEAARIANEAGKTYIERLTESQQKYANTQTGDSNMVNIINTLMPKGFLDNVESSGMQPTLKELKDQLSKEQIAAIDKALRKGNIASKIEAERAELKAEAASIVEQQKKEQRKAQAGYQASQVQKKKNQSTAKAALKSNSEGQKQARAQVARSENRSQTQNNLNKVNASLKNIASGGSGGFNKGGLMKKPNKK